MDEALVRIETIAFEVTIDGSTAQVWTALTKEIGKWWPDDFYAGGTPGKRGFQLDAEPGGRMYEHWEDGGGALWGTVVAFEPEKSLQVLGHLFPNWGGPNQWYGTWQLSEAGNRTVLTFSETVLGKISEKGIQEKDKGWRYLWASLKARVEGAPPPQWTN